LTLLDSGTMADCDVSGFQLAITSAFFFASFITTEPAPPSEVTSVNSLPIFKTINWTK